MKFKELLLMTEGWAKTKPDKEDYEKYKYVINELVYAANMYLHDHNEVPDINYLKNNIQKRLAGMDSGKWRARGIIPDWVYVEVQKKLQSHLDDIRKNNKEQEDEENELLKKYGRGVLKEGDIMVLYPPMTNGEDTILPIFIKIKQYDVRSSKKDDVYSCSLLNMSVSKVNNNPMNKKYQYVAKVEPGDRVRRALPVLYFKKGTTKLVDGHGYEGKITLWKKSDPVYYCSNNMDLNTFKKKYGG